MSVVSLTHRAVAHSAHVAETGHFDAGRRSFLGRFERAGQREGLSNRTHTSSTRARDRVRRSGRRRVKKGEGGGGKEKASLSRGVGSRWKKIRKKENNRRSHIRTLRVVAGVLKTRRVLAAAGLLVLEFNVVGVVAAAAAEDASSLLSAGRVANGVESSTVSPMFLIPRFFLHGLF